MISPKAAKSFKGANTGPFCGLNETTQILSGSTVTWIRVFQVAGTESTDDSHNDVSECLFIQGWFSKSFFWLWFRSGWRKTDAPCAGAPDVRAVFDPCRHEGDDVMDCHNCWIFDTRWA
jgi:hypothetical protein